MNPQENSTQPLASIAHDSLVEVRVQVGSITLELGQLARLRPGQILDCDRPAGSVVDLVVSGTVVARGELVVVDDRLGVRVLTAPRS